MKEKIKIQEIGFITHDVLQIRTTRPADYDFSPGQATEMAIDREGWRDEKSPFTFTSLPGDGFLEFTIKVYPDHNGMTDQLQTLEAGDQLLIGDSWGAITYKGPGLFLAGGAGITPFISIFRNLAKKGQVHEQKVLFANKRERDIIMESEFQSWLGKDFVNILSEEQSSRHPHGYLDAAFIEKNAATLDKFFYVCGPPPMMEQVVESLEQLGVSRSKMVTEDFV